MRQQIKQDRQLCEQLLSPTKQLELARNTSNKLFMRARAMNQPNAGRYTDMHHLNREARQSISNIHDLSALHIPKPPK